MRNPSPETAFHRALDGSAENDDDDDASLAPLVRLVKALEQLRPEQDKPRRLLVLPRDHSMRS